MKKEHVFTPIPKSSFNKIKCAECNEEQVVYSHNTIEVMCNSCGNILAKTRGTKSRIHGKISESTQ